jgi:hypothetical protein
MKAKIEKTISRFYPYEPLVFSEIQDTANSLADIIEARRNKLVEVLLKYENFDVVQDEIGRTLDLLRNLEENKSFFKLRVGASVAFLPRNQPLYAFSCFVIVPSFMTSEVHFRIPHSMQHFFTEMLETLDIKDLFPNIFVSSKTRSEFLRDRSAILVSSTSKESAPLTDVVIFTGRPAHAEQLRLIFDKRTLFITNGSGHNPVVVGPDADVSRAVDAVTTLQFYNMGQDCAAPNAILVHADLMPEFMTSLHKKIQSYKIGPHSDRTAQIGPLSDPGALVEVEEFLVENQVWLDPIAPGIIRTKDAIVEPTIIIKPLHHGGNFHETFAPIIIVQEYDNDTDLRTYFEDQRYAPYAMYVTLYGKSEYISKITSHPIGGRILHKDRSVLFNTHLHAPGIERGVEPYGGYGYSASSICINGKITPMPTLPQRDIFEQIAETLLEKKTPEELTEEYKKYNKIEYKNVEKLLKLRIVKEENRSPIARSDTPSFLDVHTLKIGKSHFALIDDDNIYSLLKNPNAEYIASLNEEAIRSIRSLNDLLARKGTLAFDEFTVLLYSLSKRPNGSSEDDKERQRLFFQHIYNLLFGKNAGPRLSFFLWEISDPKISKLLNV